MKKITALILFMLVSSVPLAGHAEVALAPSVGVAMGDNLRPSAVGTLRLRESHTPIGLEAFAFLPWGIGGAISLDALRTERLTIKLIDVGVFVPVFSNVSVTNFKRDFDLALGTGILWKPNYEIYGHQPLIMLDWKIFLPDPRLIGRYGDFIRPIYEQAFSESFLVITFGWK